MFEKEKKQYDEDCKTHERRPWELWQYAVKNRDVLDWCDLISPPQWADYCVYRRKPTTFVPECYSGLNWREADHLIGETVECTNNPDRGWYVGTLKQVLKIDVLTRFGVLSEGDFDFVVYIRTCEETFKHPTINIGGVELPMPMPETVAPSHGTKYWTFPGCICHIWNGFTFEMDFLKAGQVHLTEDNAKAWADWWKKEVLAKIKEIGS